MLQAFAGASHRLWPKVGQVDFCRPAGVACKAVAQGFNSRASGVRKLACCHFQATQALNRAEALGLALFASVLKLAPVDDLAHALSAVG